MNRERTVNSPPPFPPPSSHGVPRLAHPSAAASAHSRPNGASAHANPTSHSPQPPLPPTNGDSHPNGRPRSSKETPSNPQQYSTPANSNPPPPPLSLGTGGPPQQGPSVLQILAMGQERNHAADSMAHHPRIESLVKLGKESEATWLQIGATAETLADWDRALAAYESALRHNAYSIVALSQIAAICRAQEEFKKAAEYFGRVVGIAPENGDVWGALGHCYLMIDDLKKAYSSYQQALYYMPNPQEPKLWYGIGILYDRYGSLEHAEEAFSSVIRMDPNFEKANEIFFRLGIIYKQQRKSAQSLECFRYILQNPPRPLTEIDIWFQIGHVYEQQKDFLAAKDSYERVLAENPAHAKVLQQLGGLYHRSRAPFYNPEVSVTILTKSLESDANDPFSWYLLGRAYMTTSNFGKAYEAYQQAVYRDGKNPAFWCSIGVLYYNINQFHDALDAYSRAIRIHPYLAEVWFNLGALYESCNDQMTDAVDAYQRTLQLDPTNTIVSTRLREIREHQASGSPLSSPPTPKDISPSSVSWNYATNTGGAPAHLAQAGLGPDISPRPNQSPAVGGVARFESNNGRDPIASGSRPRSTDPHRLTEERRRASGGHAGSPSVTNDNSPRMASSYRAAAGPASLPQIKSMQDPRGSPPIDPRHRRSPPSPRTRPAELVAAAPDHLAYSPQQTQQTGHYPSTSHVYPRGPPMSAQELSDREMEWERAGRNGRTSSAQSRRSPPGSSHSARDAHPHPPPAHFPHLGAFDRRGPSPTNGRSLPSDERDPRFSNVAPPPPPHPGYAYFPDRAPPTNPPYDGRRYDPLRDRGEAVLEEERIRRGGSAGTIPRPDHSPRLSHLVDANAGARVGTASPSTVKPPAKGRRLDGGGAEKREKKATTSAAAKRGEGGSAKEKKKNAAASKTAVKEMGASTATPGSSPRVAAALGPSLPIRAADEDYDEGVDALLGLAKSATSLSPRNAATSHAQNPLVAAPSPKSASVVESDNPRKRSLTSPVGTESKRSKSGVPSPPSHGSEQLVTVKVEPLVEMTNGTNGTTSKEANGASGGAGEKDKADAEEAETREEGETMSTNGSVAITA